MAKIEIAQKNCQILNQALKKKFEESAEEAKIEKAAE